MMKSPMYKTKKEITILYDQKDPITFHIVPSGYHDYFIILTEDLTDIQTQFMSREEVIEQFGEEVLNTHVV